MRITRKTGRRGFTLIELVTAGTLVAMVALIVGTLLVSDHKHTKAMFGRVFRQETEDTFTVHRAFDSICRKASSRKTILGPGQTSLELYYWESGSIARTPENYARFYMADDTLKIEYGKMRPDAWTPDPGKPVRQFVAARNVNAVQFDTQGPTVQMVLTYADPDLMPVICSSVRHNF